MAMAIRKSRGAGKRDGGWKIEYEKDIDSSRDVSHDQSQSCRGAGVQSDWQ